MDDFPKPRARQLARWLTVVVLNTAAVVLTKFIEPYPTGIFYALPLIGLSGLLMLPELSRPLTLVIDIIFGTGHAEGGKPPLDLRLARAYVKQERWEEALEEYLRMMKHHPHVSEAYEQAMILTARTTGDRAKVEGFFKRGERKIGSMEEKADLRAAFNRAKEEIRGYER